MGIHYKFVNQDEDFKATIATLTCNITNKPLASILIKNPDADIFTRVKAISPFAARADSGEHIIKGLLAYGPIDETNDEPTIISDLQTEANEDGTLSIILKVIKK